MMEVLTFFNGVNASKWIPKLWTVLKKIRQDREKELEEINKIVIGDPVELAKYYIEPDSQEMNPADFHEEDRMVSKQPVMVKINEFLEQTVFHQGSNQLFVLSDAGMGKTSLLTMLKLMHMTKFWPQDRNCVLKKLGFRTLQDIQRIGNKRKTILLLDSLDEDPMAYGRVRDRLLEILEASKHFAKVIITCRTQFFPETEHDHLERPGQIIIEGYSCYSKYLSFFDDEKVFQYLSKRFPARFFGLMGDHKKIDEAKKIIGMMGSLRCRPMLLSYIEDLINSPLMEKGLNEYHVFEALVDSWLRREERKNKGISRKDIYVACIILAVVMQIMQKRGINEAALDKLIGRIAEVKTITKIEMKGRSLLNRNSEGEYRFSHYSIQEFCVAKFLGDKPLCKLNTKIPITNKIWQMVAMSEAIYPDWANLVKINQSEDVQLKFNRFGMNFVYIPPGSYFMGNDETFHKVTLKNAFYLQIAPVTQSQWEAVMGNNPSEFKGSGDGPVETVSWVDVMGFIKKLNEKEGSNRYRLPTESEWEYACRAGTTSPFSFGDNVSKLGEYGWFTDNSEESTQPVGAKKHNPWGLYDMHGNVWEWVEDDWHETYKGAPIDGTAWIDKSRSNDRVIRGGSWYSRAHDCISSFRYNYSHLYRYPYVGFRIARSVDPAQLDSREIIRAQRIVKEENSS